MANAYLPHHSSSKTIGMKSIFFSRLLWIALSALWLSAATPAAAQTKSETIQASYFTAFGRYPNYGEMNYWLQNMGNMTAAQLVERHRAFIQASATERTQTIQRSYQDALGRWPTADELNFWSQYNQTYAELMARHVNGWLNVYAEEKKKVIRASYQTVFSRNPSDAELNYWMQQATCSFVQYVAMHSSWKQQNAGSSSGFAINNNRSILPNLNTSQVSTAVLSNAALSALIAAGGGNLVSTNGGNVIAQGGGNVIAQGGGNVIAAGGGNVIAAGAGNLTAH
jgi:hypothetical protein